MNDIEFDDFLVRGWEHEAVLFYEGKAYFFQCDYLAEEDMFHLYIVSYKALKLNERSLSAYVYPDSSLVDYKYEVDVKCKTYEEAKQICFSGKFFDGKSFWEIGKKFDWLEDDGPDIAVQGEFEHK